eukprot:TRINITY_DN46884_c0_g1_i1.p1 TRINITY_DN46884_c0_g1~~TRINITY_DN46884_c0_g1_i1.p1  ORF type:complete len:381 (-),score=55.57 TRINITY_DN46884_c0_g1_i1:191-1273(-)
MANVLSWILLSSCLMSNANRNDELNFETSSLLQVALDITSTSDDAQSELLANRKSEQLGNFISYWYFASLPFEHSNKKLATEKFQRLSTLQCQSEETPTGTCFGGYLSTKLGAGVSPLSDEKKREVVALREITVPLLYSLGSRHDLAQPIGDDLWAQMYDYASHVDPSLLVAQSNTCIVHYRVGDLVNSLVSWGNEASVLSTRSVASAVASLRPHQQLCSSVEILGSGATHPCMDFGKPCFGKARNVTKQERASLSLLTQLKQDIEAQLPHAKVEVRAGGTADEDFYKMATAPGLVIGAGSFAVAGALAGRNNDVLSPAARDWLCLQCGQDEPMEVRPNWRTYKYELQPVNIDDWTDNPI